MGSIQGLQLYRLATVDKPVEIIFNHIINIQIRDHCIDLKMEIMLMLNQIEIKIMGEQFQLLKVIDKLRELMEIRPRILLLSLILINL